MAEWEEGRRYTICQIIILTLIMVGHTHLPRARPSPGRRYVRSLTSPHHDLRKQMLLTPANR